MSQLLSLENAVIVSNGGHLYSSGCFIGEQSVRSRLVVTGPGSIYKNAGGLFVQYDVSELLISNGGRVENTDAGLFNTVVPSKVTGAGSAWINSGRLSVLNSELIISEATPV